MRQKGVETERERRKIKMITIDKAIDILRGMRAKTRKPVEKKMLPQYMQNWDDRKIDEYYEKQKVYGDAFDVAIRCMQNITQFRKASYDMVDLFDNFTESENQGNND